MDNDYLIFMTVANFVKECKSVICLLIIASITAITYGIIINSPFLYITGGVPLGYLLCGLVIASADNL
jgi:hypothetical protein